MKRLLLRHWARAMAAFMTVPMFLFTPEFQRLFAEMSAPKLVKQDPSPGLQQNLKELRASAKAALVKVQANQDASAELAQVEAKKPLLQADEQTILAQVDASQPVLPNVAAVDRFNSFKNAISARFDSLLAEIDAVSGATTTTQKITALTNLIALVEQDLAPIPSLPIGVPPGIDNPPPVAPFKDITLGQFFQQATGPAAAADLAATEDAPLSPEITGLAASLGNNPVRIVEHVRTNFKYEPYYGSRKGAIGVLREGAGNDADQASLTAALLRASGVHCRLVYATVRVEGPTLISWLGVENMTAALSVLDKNEIPAQTIIENGVIKAVLMDRAWVRAYVNVKPYRGAAAAPGLSKRFFDIDPSMRLTTISARRDVGAETNFNAATFLTDIKNQSTVNTTTGGVSNLPAAFIINKILTVTNSVEAYLAANSLTPATAFRTAAENAEHLGVLPVTRLYRVLNAGVVYDQWPSTFRYKIQITLQNPDGSSSITYLTSLPQIAGKRLTLAYIPATADDQSIIIANQSALNFPAFLVNLKPQLLLDGAVSVTGAAVGMGQAQSLTTQFTAPASAAVSDQTQTLVTAGSYSAILFQNQRTGTNALLESRARLESASASFTSIDASEGELLRAVGLNYLFESDNFDRIAAGNLDVSLTRDVSETLVTRALKVATLFDLPNTAKANAVQIDVLRDHYKPVSISATAADEVRFLIAAGLANSAAEHASLTQMLQVEGVSTVRLLELANAQLGQSFYRINASNVGLILPLLGHPQDVLTDIQNAVAAGSIVVISTGPVTFGGVQSASAYVVINTQSGANRFVIRRSPAISGGIALTEELKAAALLSPDAPAVYKAQVDKGLAWYQSLLSATDRIGSAFVPSTLALDVWLQSNPIPDAATLMAGVLAISSPLTTLAIGPAIFNAQANNALISPNGNGIQDSITVTANVTQGATWTIKFLNSSNVVMQSTSAASSLASASFSLTEFPALTPIPNGTYVWRVEAVKGAEQAVPRGGTFLIDNTPPTAVIIQPVEAASLSGITSPIIGTASDANFQGYSVDIAPAGSPGAAQPLNISSSPKIGALLSPFDTTKFANGNYIITLAVSDRAGNFSTAVRTITINNPVSDPNPPVVSISAPAPNAVLTGTVPVVVNSSDAVGVTSVTLKVDGAAVGTSTAPSPTVFTLDTTAFPNCPHNLTASAVDPNGNVGTSPAVLVFFQNVVTNYSLSSPFFFPPPDNLLDTITIHANLSSSQSWTVEIFNSSNILVRTFTGTGDLIDIVWDGKDQSGNFVPDGVYTIKVTAGGQNAVRIVTIASTVPDPVAIIHTISENQEITEKTPVRITATTPNQTFFNSWELKIFSGVDGQPGNVLVYSAQSFSPVVDQLVSMFDASYPGAPATTEIDPTKLANGNYFAQLKVKNNALVTIGFIVDFTIAGEQKVGNFKVTFQDLQVPVLGTPITITRTYDSFDMTSADFGPGWKLDVVAGEIREDLAFNVFLRTPDGRKTPFRNLLNPFGQFVPPYYVTIHYTSRKGVHYNLVPQGDTDLIRIGDELFYLDGMPYNPPGYKLSETNGTQYIYTMAENVGRLVEKRDPNGNRLLISDTGVSYVNAEGFVESGITITRDGSGRILSIQDPDPLHPPLTYEYTGAHLTKFTDRDNRVTEFFYTPQGRLDHIKDPLNQNPIQNVYDNTGRVIGHLDADGHLIALSHNVDSRVETVTDRRGFSTAIKYDADGLVTQQTDPLGGVSKTDYDGDQNPMKETDPLGNATNSTFDIFGDVTARTDPLNHTSHFAYNERGLPTVTADPLGHATTNTYDSKGNYLSTIDPLGHSTSNVYDNFGKLLATVNPDGTSTGFVFTPNTGVLLFRGYRDAQGVDQRIEHPVFDDNRNVTATHYIKPNTSTTEITLSFYNASGQLIKAVDEEGFFTETVYNDRGQPALQIDKNLNVTQNIYDDQGRLTKTIYPPITIGGSPVSPFEEFGYDLSGNRTSFKDRNGNVTTTDYDANNRPTTVHNPDGTTRTTVYDAAGRVISQVDERGFITQFQYDQAGRRVATIDPLGHTTSFTYDAAGRQLSVTDPSDHVTSFEYDAAGRQTKITHPDGTFKAFTYDAMGRKISETDENGVTQLFEYDFEGRLAKVMQPNPANANVHDVVTEFKYDFRGRKIEQIDALGRSTKWSYNKRGDVTSHQLPGGQSESFTHDGNGNVLSHTRYDGTVVNFTYNALNQVTSKTSSSGGSRSFSYTAGGQRSSMSSNGDSWTFAYNSRNQLTQEVTPIGTLGYSYDGARNRTTLTTPSQTLTYAFDGLNRPIGMNKTGAAWASASYDPNGNLAGRSYANGTSVAYSYNSKNQLLSIVHSKGTAPFASFDYTVDATGKRTGVTEFGGRHVDYGYDFLNRLTSEFITEASGAKEISYLYDKVSNRLSKTQSGFPPAENGTTIYQYNNNDQLTQENRPSATLFYAYNQNGETTQISSTVGGSTSYTWDFEGRMTAASGPGQTLSFSYDPDGIRFKKTANGTVTKYLVDRNQPFQQVLEDRNGSNQVVANYQYLDDLVSAEFGGVGNRFYQYDGQMSTRLLTDGAGTVTDTYTYDAFGVTLASTVTTTANNYLYTGEQLDPNVGFYYLRARYLNQTAGRFLSRDSFRGFDTDPLSLHKYLYANQRPTDLIDPAGLFGVYEVLIVIFFLTYVMSLIITAGYIVRENIEIAGLKTHSPNTIQGLKLRLALNFLGQEGALLENRDYLTMAVGHQMLVSEGPMAELAKTFAGVDITVFNAEPGNDAFSFSTAALATILVHENIHRATFGLKDEPDAYLAQAKAWVDFRVDNLGNASDTYVKGLIWEALKQYGIPPPNGFTDPFGPLRR